MAAFFNGNMKNIVDTSASAEDAATTYEEREAHSRSMSGASVFSDENSQNNSESPTNQPNDQFPEVGSDDDTSDLTNLPCSPTIAPLSLSIAAMSMTSVEAPPEDLLPPLSKPHVFHRTVTTSDIIEPARKFSHHSDPHLMIGTCKRLIPGWAELSGADIDVNQIMSGLSNQLFKVGLRDDLPERARYSYTEVLFRIYGDNVNELYDSATEIKVFKKLGRRGVAPQLIGEFDGGRVEEWIDGSPLLREDMCRSNVLVAAANILAGIHLIDLSKHIDTEPCITKCLKRWRKGAMETYNNVKPGHPSYERIQELDLPRLYTESFKLMDYLFPSDAVETPITRIAFCHNDVQENNIMVTPVCMRVIDFEYSGYNYPAYDLASYFIEVTCDYCVDTYPFFHIDPKRKAPQSKRDLFAAVYLSSYLRRPIKTSDRDLLDPFLDAVDRFELANHMLWGFWSVIRAPQAPTATSFDMYRYAFERIQLYWSRKEELISAGLIPPTPVERARDS